MKLSLISQCASLVASMALVFACGDGRGETDESSDELRYDCMAMPACSGQDQRVENRDSCLQDVACYSRTKCGKTIWCSGGDGASCEATPSCEAGDEQVASSDSCLQDIGCYSRSMCGQTIWCSATGGASEGELCGGFAATECRPGLHCDNSLGVNAGRCR